MRTERDQAQKLRELVRRVSGQRIVMQRSPEVVAIVGCCPEVGTPAIATRLGAELTAKAIQVEIRSNEDLLNEGQLSGEIAVVDGGTECSQNSASRWNRIRMVLFVVTSAREVILETYVAIKMAKLYNPDLPAFLLPHQCRDGLEAQTIHQRITNSCERFLGFSVPIAPWLPQLAPDEEQETADSRFLKLATFVHEHCLAQAALEFSAA